MKTRIQKNHKSLEELIHKLPPNAQEEAMDFVEFLLIKSTKKLRGIPKFKWAGALKK